MLVDSGFRPAWWLPGAHLQTQFATLFRRRPALQLQRERVELPDGDFIDLDWNQSGGDKLILVLHGLEGSVRSPYASGMLNALEGAGFRAVLINFRGCSGTPNRLARSYHSGETRDLDYITAALATRFPNTPLGIIGFSLGGNVLLKWLGEKGDTAPVRSAVAVSVPFSLGLCADKLNTGPSKFYQWYLLRKLKRSLARKRKIMPVPVEGDARAKLATLRDFDHHITAPLHGFQSAEHYYTESSSRPWLKRIAIQTLILHAEDDPFMTPAVIPADTELSPAIRLELSRTGGHVGFISGNLPWAPRYWLEERICRFFRDSLTELDNGHA